MYVRNIRVLIDIESTAYLLQTSSNVIVYCIQLDLLVVILITKCTGMSAT